MKRFGAVLVVVLGLAGALVGSGAGAAVAAPFPSRIDLPDGFQPEGIAVGKGTTFYVGSIPTGAIYRGDLRTGFGDVIAPGGAGSAATGIAVDDQDRLFVAGGETGQARVVDGRSGALLATYHLTTSDSFINDVVITKDAAWFTDSSNPVLYRVPLDLTAFTTVPLTGDLVYEDGFNVNGIDATANGKTLILVQSNTGLLFTADPASGTTRQIDLDGETVANGDGILLRGRTLFVVQNQMNRVAVIGLSTDLASGNVTTRIANDGFDVPTTIDRFGNRLYAVNARFNTPPAADTEYWVTGFTVR